MTSRLGIIRALSILCVASAPLTAQLEPPSTGGFIALDQALRSLGQYKRVLMIAAHPDDEDTELLAILARGMGAEAAYLSLNRGEGGQNLIGNELGEALGLLRSEELISAERLDGASQFFTRAYDFGFSKTLEDTWNHWPRDSVLKDVVRIIRRYRPQIIVSIFSGTPRDGHGQHQAAGWAAHEAFSVAGDSTRFPELASEEGLLPWAPLKLYRSTRFDSSATTLVIDGGGIDPASGQSYHQIAMRGRSLHRSQDMGQLQQLGPSFAREQLWEDRTKRGSGGFFSGIDTTLAGTPAVTARPPEIRQRLAGLLAHYTARVDSARSYVAVDGGQTVARLLRDAAADLAQASTTLRSTASPAPDHASALRIGPVRGDDFEGETIRLNNAIARTLDLVVDAFTDDPRVVAGQNVRVTAPVWNASAGELSAQLCLTPPRASWRVVLDSVTSTEVEYGIHSGSCVGYGGKSGWGSVSGHNEPLPAGSLLPVRLVATLPQELPLSSPYFLREPRDGDLYRWDPAQRESWGLPFEPPPLSVTTMVTGPGRAATMSHEVVYRTNDQGSGEVRLPVTIVPRIDVKIDPGTEVWSAPLTAVHRFTVALTHGARDTTDGQVLLKLPKGWPQPAAQRFHFTREDERISFNFNVHPPPGARGGRYELSAVALDTKGKAYDVGSYTIAYSHIRSRSYLRSAKATVGIAPLLLPPLSRVGYIRGAADRVPEALKSVGVPIEMLTGAELEDRDLRRYDAIVIGSRAYETDPDLPVNNDRLLAYARGGGLVIVQYQQYEFFSNSYAPYLLTVGGRPAGVFGPVASSNARSPSGRNTMTGPHDRVTDENAVVTAVRPADPILLRPNRIGRNDWNGWVQERGLYFARSWDAQFRSVVSMHDAGESPLEGSLLVAPVGRGTYVYTALSFFRQLPAGVPGAYRLFANLLALRERRMLAPPTRPRSPLDTLKVEQ